MLVDAGCIHLLLGEIFCSHKLRFMEGLPPEVGALEVSSLEVSSPKVGPFEVRPKEGGSLEVGQDRVRVPHILSWQPYIGEIGAVEFQWPLKRLGVVSYGNHAPYNDDPRSDSSEETTVVSKMKSATPMKVSIVLFSVSEHCLWTSRTTSGWRPPTRGIGHNHGRHLW